MSPHPTCLLQISLNPALRGSGERILHLWAGGAPLLRAVFRAAWGLPWCYCTCVSFFFLVTDGQTSTLAAALMALSKGKPLSK